MKPKQTRRPVPGAARSALKRPPNRMAARPSAAKPQQPALRLNAAAGDFIRSRRFNVYTLLTVALVVLTLILVGPMVQVWVNQQRDIAAVQAKLDQAKKDLAAMRVERTRWDDPVYIRAQARERLYYVLPGEISYLVMDADQIDANDDSGTVGAALAKARNSDEISSSIMRVKKNWVDTLTQSVLKAGLAEPDPDAATGKETSN